MAKFCGNCGTQLDDNARVCGNCGTPLSGTASTAPNVKIVDPEKEKARQQKIKKLIKLGTCLAALILIVVVAINVITKFTGYNGLLRKTLAAYEDYDINKLVSVSSDLYYYSADDYAETYFENAVGNDMDYFESTVGHNYKLSFETNEIYTLSNRKFDSIIEDISWTYSEFDSSIIEKIVVADITVTATQGNTSTRINLNVTMSKEDGSWKLLYIE